MKIGEQALYLAQLKGMSKSDAMESVKKWFVKFEMESWWNKKVEDLSKGMSQKLQFVITVLHNPQLIILDEPFSGLDPVNANLIKEEIFTLAKNGATIIFSTHRMEQVEEICDHIVLVNKGKKILDGTVHQRHRGHADDAAKEGPPGNAGQGAKARAPHACPDHQQPGQGADRVQHHRSLHGAGAGGHAQVHHHQRGHREACDDGDQQPNSLHSKLVRTGDIVFQV
jgi:ABC-type multidrug transport system ATPase subunit